MAKGDVRGLDLRAHVAGVERAERPPAWMFTFVMARAHCALGGTMVCGVEPHRREHKGMPSPKLAMSHAAPARSSKTVAGIASQRRTCASAETSGRVPPSTRA